MYTKKDWKLFSKKGFKRIYIDVMRSQHAKDYIAFRVYYHMRLNAIQELYATLDPNINEKDWSTSSTIAINCINLFSDAVNHDYFPATEDNIASRVEMFSTAIWKELLPLADKLFDSDALVDAITCDDGDNYIPIQNHILRFTTGQGNHDEVYAYITDPLGTIRNLVDSTESIVNTYDYKAYGNIRNQTGTTPNPYLFTGRRWSDTTKDYYYRARHYMPDLGMFGAMDRYAPGEMTYGYVNGNPVMGRDPLGTAPDECNTVLMINFLSWWDRTSLDKDISDFRESFDNSEEMKWDVKEIYVHGLSKEEAKKLIMEAINNPDEDNNFDKVDFLFIHGHGGDPKDQNGKIDINNGSDVTFSPDDILDMRQQSTKGDFDPSDTRENLDYQHRRRLNNMWPDETLCFTCFSAFDKSMAEAFGGDFIGFLDGTVSNAYSTYVTHILENIANGMSLKDAYSLPFNLPQSPFTQIKLGEGPDFFSSEK